MDRADGFEGFEILRAGHSGQARAFACDKPQIGAERLGQKQNISKQDRGIKPIPPDRLQGRFNGQFGVVAQR